jgi:ATP-dependent protease ClpP protease subunit
VAQVADDFERDRWMDAHAAKEYGIVDDILGDPVDTKQVAAERRQAE